MGCRAIILCAGISSRIFELTKGLPKGLMEVQGEPVVGRIIRLLNGAGVTDITLVVGYREELFRERFPGCNFVTNPEYRATNTCVSLELALRTGETDSVFVINGDVYFEEGILQQMLSSGNGTVAAVSRHPLTDEEIKVFNQDGMVTKIGKHLNEDLAYGEAFGIYLMSPRFAVYMKRELNLLNNPKVFYEAAMDRLLSGGHEMHILDVGNAIVQELDFPADYAALMTTIADRKE
ncbi:MAG TPA: phosphocholine cytidylyltransferase family protein [Myxococcota bacterium]|nr:phosphocholine cytidylyltransferase family protein [Myxococcota bacterium]